MMITLILSSICNVPHFCLKQDNARMNVTQLKVELKLTILVLY